MGVIPCVAQLCIYPHAVIRSLHAALEQMRHAELSPDFAEIARHLALVLHHTRTADDLQVRDPCQIGQNLVLHPVGEESVVGVTPEIIERQYSDAFLWNGRSLSCCGSNRRNGRCRSNICRRRRTSRPEDGTNDQRGDENNCGCNNPASALLLSNYWRSTLSCLAELLRHLGITKVFGVEINHSNPNAVFHLAFAKIMQVPLPLTVLFQILGHMFGDEDVAGVTTIHYSLGDIDPGSGNV